MGYRMDLSLQRAMPMIRGRNVCSSILLSVLLCCKEQCRWYEAAIEFLCMGYRMDLSLQRAMPMIRGCNSIVLCSSNRSPSVEEQQANDTRLQLYYIAKPHLFNKMLQRAMPMIWGCNLIHAIFYQQTEMSCKEQCQWYEAATLGKSSWELTITHSL